MRKKSFLFGLVVILIMILFSKDQLKTVQFPYLFFALFVYLFVLSMRAAKLRKIILEYYPIEAKETFHLTAITQLLGAFIPGRAGEILLSTYMKLKHSVDISKLLPILFIDKIFELFCVLFYSIISITFFNKDVLNIVFNYLSTVTNGKILYIITAITIIVLIFFVIFYKKTKTKLVNIIENVKYSVRIPFEKPKVGLIILINSLILIVSEFLFMYLIFQAFNFDINLSKIIIIHSFGMIVGVISMIPGGQGSTELSMLSLLHIWGYSASNAVVPVLASKIYVYIILFVCGLPLLSYGVSIISKRKEEEKNES